MPAEFHLDVEPEAYDDIRCMPVRSFPYMIHYRVLESQQTISVKAVFCTYDDPDKWEERIE